MYQCPNCSGNLKFDIPSQQLLCSYCNSSFNPYEITKESDGVEKEYFETTIYTCPQCGGEIMSADTDVAAFCSYCGASTVLTERISKEKRPDYIIPFRKTKEDCKEAFIKKMRTAFFAPKAYKDVKAIDSFRGIYMPYWTYDIEEKGDIDVPGETSHRSGNYIVTKHYRLKGTIDARYEGFAHDASSTFYDDISEVLAPYDTREQVAFTPSMLSGFYADGADVDNSVYGQDAKEFARESTVSELWTESAFKPYLLDREKTKRNLPEPTIYQPKRAMYPVWFMSYQKDGRVAYAAVNGQTGKVSADVPIDPLKYIIISLVVSVPMFVWLNGFLALNAIDTLVVSAVLLLVSMFILNSEMRQIQKAESHKDDKGMQAKHRKPLQAKGGLFGVQMLFSVVVFVLAVVIRVMKPVSDVIFYGGTLLVLVMIMLNSLYIIKNYNRLAMRRLPQFEKKGGDDRA